MPPRSGAGTGEEAPGLSSLFDLQFRDFITPELIKALYKVGLFLGVLVALALAGIGIFLLVDRGSDVDPDLWWVGLLYLAGAPVFLLFYLVYLRVSCELVMVAFRIEANTR